MINHSKPTLTQEDYEAVLEVLQSGHLVQGNSVSAFEQYLSSFIGVSEGVAVSSGTAALHLSLLALGIGGGDEVIIPSYVCPALLNAVRYVNARPVISDIDGATFNVDVTNIKGRITPRTKAVIVPHMFGRTADIDAIAALGIPVIEDCAQSVGARHGQAYTGSFGICSIVSFYATKMLTTGEGGMVLSNDAQFSARVRDLRDYDEKEGNTVRYNYKMTDMQAALGVSQLQRLPSFIERRKEIAARYSTALSDIGISGPLVPQTGDHIFYRYIVLTRDLSRFTDRMAVRGITCRRPVFKPIHHYLGLSDCPVTDDVFRRAVSIPLYPSLSDDDVARIAAAMIDSLAH